MTSMVTKDEYIEHLINERNCLTEKAYWLEIRNKKLRKRCVILTILLIAAIIAGLIMCVLYTNSQYNYKETKRDFEIVSIKYIKLQADYELQDDKFMEELINLENKYKAALHMTKDWRELVMTMQLEAGGQGEEGLMHCTSTVINRVNNSHWGYTIHDVLSASGQYNAYDPARYKVALGKDIMPETIQAVDKVLLYGPINQSMYFINPDSASTASRNWLRTKTLELKYKSHEFYKE